MTIPKRQLYKKAALEKRVQELEAQVAEMKCTLRVIEAQAAPRYLLNIPFFGLKEFQPQSVPLPAAPIFTCDASGGYVKATH